MIAKEKIQQAVMNEIADNWATTAVDYPGVGFDVNAQDEWIQPTVIRNAPHPSRKARDDTRIHLDINVFVRQGTNSNAHRVQELADGVAVLFDQVEVDLLDSSATIRFGEVEFTELGVVVRNDDKLQQINLAVIGSVIH